MIYKFKKMLGPYTDWPTGSPEWAERISALLQIEVESVSISTVHSLKKLLKQIFSVKPFVWEIWPSLEQPIGTPDDYFLKVTGHNWETLCAIVAELGGDATFNKREQWRLS